MDKRDRQSATFSENGKIYREYAADEPPVSLNEAAGSEHHGILAQAGLRSLPNGTVPMLVRHSELGMGSCARQRIQWRNRLQIPRLRRCRRPADAAGATAGTVAGTVGTAAAVGARVSRNRPLDELRIVKQRYVVKQ